MITNMDVYRCYSVNLQQYLTTHGIRYFLIAKDIKSDRTFWAYERNDTFNKILQQWIQSNPKQ